MIYLSQFFCKFLTYKCFEKFLYQKDGTKSRILILNEIYSEGVERIGREFSVERLLRSTREMKVYMKEFG